MGPEPGKPSVHTAKHMLVAPLAGEFMLRFWFCFLGFLYFHFLKALGIKTYRQMPNWIISEDPVFYLFLIKIQMQLK